MTPTLEIGRGSWFFAYPRLIRWRARYAASDCYHPAKSGRSARSFNLKVFPGAGVRVSGDTSSISVGSQRHNLGWGTPEL